MNKPQTAEEFLKNQPSYTKNLHVFPTGTGKIIQQNMIEFAKQWVEYALNEAANKARITEISSVPDDDYEAIFKYVDSIDVEEEYIVSKDSIINSIDLNDIK